MPAITVLSASPSATSRTAALAGHVARRLAGEGHVVTEVHARDLPPAPLLAADTSDPSVARVLGQIAGADGVVVASPVYKASYSGLLKVVLDVLPQSGLGGKVVLPLLTGGTPAHVLAVDYALRPVLASLGADHIVQGTFVLDRHIEVRPGAVSVDPASGERLHAVVDRLSAALHAARPLLATA